MRENDAINILLADDDETDRILFKEALKDIEMNTVISVVKNGVELTEYLEANLNELPDLLFLDLNMPQKNGMECLLEIKSNPLYKNICIAIYSTSASEEDIENTFMNGANVYIQKPVDFDKLKAVLKKAIVSTHNYQSPPFNKANFLLRI